MAKIGKRGFFYGWVVAVAGGIAIMAGSNLQYTFGVFVKPMVDRFDWSRTEISGAASARMIAQLVSLPTAGALGDRYGSKRLILLGIFLAGLGYLLFSHIGSLWQLYAIMTLLIGVGSSLVFVPAVALVTKWFGRKAGLANGIAVSGHSLAQIILPPVALYLLLRYGWTICFLSLAPAIWVIGLIAWLFIKTPVCPTQEAKAEPKTDRTLSETTGGQDSYTLVEALHTRSVWPMFIFNLAIGICWQLLTVHIVPAAIDAGIVGEAAAITLTLGGAGSTTGRLLSGLVARKIGNRMALALCFGIQMLSFFLLVAAHDKFAFYTLAVAIGLGYGGVSPLMPTIAGSYFGTKSLGSIYGILQAFYCAGGAIGPFLAGYIFDVTGSYHIAFLSAAGTLLLALLSCLLLKAPTRGTPATASHTV